MEVAVVRNMGRRADRDELSTGPGRMGARRDLRATHSHPKTPLVLLHPFSLSTDVWAPILPALEQHHAVFPLKLPGHMGAAPLPLGCEHSIERFADILEAQLD